MNGYLLDTNHATPFIENDSLLLARAAKVAHPILFCRPSIGELWHGVFGSGRIDENRDCLLRVLKGEPVVEFDAEAAIEFGRIMAAQGRKGKKIPKVDVQIAAIAHVHSLIILTADKHFGFIDGITVENWLG